MNNNHNNNKKKKKNNNNKNKASRNYQTNSQITRNNNNNINNIMIKISKKVDLLHQDNHIFYNILLVRCVQQQHFSNLKSMRE